MQLQAWFAWGALVGTTAVIGAWAWARLRPSPAARALRAWGDAQGVHRRGDGVDQPLELVGRRRDRLFTVALQRGPPEVLLLAIDCDAGGDGPLSEGRHLSDGALATRVTAPPVALCADPGPWLDALADAAEALEADTPSVR